MWPTGAGPNGKIGLAVSGGPDSLAMLLLAHGSMPRTIEAATVDHGLRPEAAAEAAHVAQICAEMGVPHQIFRVNVAAGNVQDEARNARYAALAAWATDRNLAAIATARHAEDQAETMVMRLNRGSGLSGLTGIRQQTTVPGSHIPLLRPLLGWRRQELAEVVEGVGIAPVHDPSNLDMRFDRVKMRQHLARAEWIDPLALAASARHLADAEDALAWAVTQEWDRCVRQEGAAWRYRPAAPRAIRLRVVTQILEQMGGNPRGSAVARLVDALDSGEGGPLAGALARVDNQDWVFAPEPGRRQR